MICWARIMHAIVRSPQLTALLAVRLSYVKIIKTMLQANTLPALGGSDPEDGPDNDQHSQSEGAPQQLMPDASATSRDHEADGAAESSSSSALLVLRHVWLRYGAEGGPWALKGISLQCRAGETLGICGRTGAVPARCLHLPVRLHGLGSIAEDTAHCMHTGEALVASEA